MTILPEIGVTPALFKKPRIYIFKQSMDNLKSLVTPYFIKEMLYKLGL